MKTDEFNYSLPQSLIAQTPLAQRDGSRLMVLERENGSRSADRKQSDAGAIGIQHKQFTDILDYFKSGDILIVNNSRVLPARLYGRKSSGGKAEILLLKQLNETSWRVLIGGKKMRAGTTITLLTSKGGNETDWTAEITAVFDGPQREIQFNQPIEPILDDIGHTPLPPYIHTQLEDDERYQTVYSQPTGSAAAPTAGLHFSSDLLFALREKGVLFETVTLHVGLDTFKPVEAELISNHTIHSEWATLSQQAAKRINEAKLAGGRLIAVGTTAVRTLETGALRSAGIVGTLQTISARDASGETSNMCPWKPVSAFEGPTDLFIYPGYKFRAVDMMITNFHLPQSSLLMLVSAFAGQEVIKTGYETAVSEKYRFFSFGDAMLIM